MFNEELFYDACVEEIIDKNTIKLTVRLDDSKVLNTFSLDDVNKNETDGSHDETNDLFMLDVLNLMIPKGTFVKIKVIDGRVIIFNKLSNKNLNSIIKKISYSIATYTV
jgi:hypothetical protein